MHSAQASRFQPALHGQVEVRGVDADDDRRMGSKQALEQRAAQAQQPRQVADHLSETKQRQLANVVPGIKALCLHARAADADKARIGIALAQGGNQIGAKLVAGIFTGEDAR